MFSRLKWIHLCPLFAGIFWALLSPVCAGTVYLKNGRVIRGPLLERSDEGVVVEMAGGRMRIYKRFIAAVVFDASDPAQPGKSAAPVQKLAGAETTPAPEPATRDLPGDPRELRRRLGKTASSSGPAGQGAPAASGRGRVRRPSRTRARRARGNAPSGGAQKTEASRGASGEAQRQRRGRGGFGP